MFKEAVYPEISRFSMPTLTVSGGEGYDKSLTATMMALVYPRLEKGGEPYHAGVRGNSAIFRPESAPHSIYFMPKINNPVSEYERCGWQYMPAVADFFQRTIEDVRVFVNTEYKTAIVSTPYLTLPKWHYLQCALPAFLPWFFDPKHGGTAVTEKEMALLQSLRERTPTRYNELIAEITRDFNIRDEFIKSNLAGFEARFETAKIRQVENLIKECNDDIFRYLDAVNQTRLRVREYEASIRGLLLKAEEAGSTNELMNYFLSAKNLTLTEVTDAGLKYIVRGIAAYYDPDEAESMIEHGDSYFYRISGELQNSHMRRLLRAIFLEQKLKLRMCAGFAITFGGTVGIVRDGLENVAAGEYYMPNPHLFRWHCMGDYASTISELCSRYDYVGAIEQSAASTMSLNFGDVTVMETFTDYIKNSRYRCIELPDGSVATPLEAAKYLMEEDNDGEED